jgi:hypothetical protein
MQWDYQNWISRKSTGFLANLKAQYQKIYCLVACEAVWFGAYAPNYMATYPTRHRFNLHRHGRKNLRSHNLIITLKILRKIMTIIVKTKRKCWCWRWRDEILRTGDPHSTITKYYFGKLDQVWRKAMKYEVLVRLRTVSPSGMRCRVVW